MRELRQLDRGSSDRIQPRPSRSDYMRALRIAPRDASDAARKVTAARSGTCVAKLACRFDPSNWRLSADIRNYFEALRSWRTSISKLGFAKSAQLEGRPFLGKIIETCRRHERHGLPRIGPCKFLAEPKFFRMQALASSMTSSDGSPPSSDLWHRDRRAQPALVRTKYRPGGQRGPGAGSGLRHVDVGAPRLFSGLRL